MPFTSAEQVGISPERLRRIDAAMARYIDRGTLAGMVTLVARKGSVVQHQAYGYADLATQRPMELDSIHRIYSMTKPVTSVALMMLYEQGLFYLDDPIAEYIPAFRDTPVFAGVASDGSVRLEPQSRPITIRHLLTHTSGLSYGGSAIPALNSLYQAAGEWRTGTDLAATVQAFAGLPLLFQPGTRWSYSFAIDVAGHLAEVLSGKPLDVYMRQALFEPLGMVDTGFQVPPAKVGRLATLYSPAEAGGLKDVSETLPAAGMKLLSGGGGLFSTAQDYCRFAQMMANGGELDGERLLAPKTVQLIGSNHIPVSLLPCVPVDWPYRVGYGMGLGVRVMLDEAAADSPGSPGLITWGGAASTDFWCDPALTFVGVIMLQHLPSSHRVIQDFRVLGYQALVG
jgi:CubicO group peptidase (beta-lactamase class C family)